ncbi:MAG: hypothetical protein COW29_04490 [Rhodobacterales bacterium CG15_BIG_FIL_POST_REV_8_21_14_020_59_13]|nr:MAG: hypothetical protein COW29_04490 [Rhodobacterales bacterium CG15_BIG_FIL_POST_REV_8_21_14_020_59_13]
MLESPKFRSLPNLHSLGTANIYRKTKNRFHIEIRYDKEESPLGSDQDEYYNRPSSLEISGMKSFLAVSVSASALIMAGCGNNASASIYMKSQIQNRRDGRGCDGLLEFYDH